jgi:hypothetical protein
LPESWWRGWSAEPEAIAAADFKVDSGVDGDAEAAGGVSNRSMTWLDREQVLWKETFRRVKAEGVTACEVRLNESR